MKITVINGLEKHGATYRLKEIFLEPFRGEAEITEYYLPKDCPNFCAGCTACFLQGEDRCKDAAYVSAIEKSLLEADLLVFVSPVYVYHASGAMKNLLDHFGYRWMPHRPAKEMFGKRAVIISQCLGGGVGSTVKDMRDSLSWWGVSTIKSCGFRLMNDIHWDKLPEEKRASMTKKLQKTAAKMKKINYAKPGRTGLITRGKFFAIRMLQKSVGKTNPDSLDFRYWRDNGWLGRERPWK